MAVVCYLELQHLLRLGGSRTLCRPRGPGTAESRLSLAAGGEYTARLLTDGSVEQSALTLEGCLLMLITLGFLARAAFAVCRA